MQRLHYKTAFRKAEDFACAPDIAVAGITSLKSDPIYDKMKMGRQRCRLMTTTKKCYMSNMGVEAVPVISIFFGIRVTMYYDDHNPPHFHAEYNDQKILVDILKGRVLKGSFSSRQLKFVLAWAEIHKDELMQNWELAKDGLSLNKIAPLM